MGIKLASAVYINQWQKRGHCGIVPIFDVTIRCDDLVIHPGETSAYDSAGRYGTREKAEKWAQRVADALGLEVIFVQGEPS